MDARAVSLVATPAIAMRRAMWLGECLGFTVGLFARVNLRMITLATTLSMIASYRDPSMLAEGFSPSRARRRSSFSHLSPSRNCESVKRQNARESSDNHACARKTGGEEHGWENTMNYDFIIWAFLTLAFLYWLLSRKQERESDEIVEVEDIWVIEYSFEPEELKFGLNNEDLKKWL